MFFLIYNFYSTLIYYSTEPLPLQALAEVPGQKFLSFAGKALCPPDPFKRAMPQNHQNDDPAALLFMLL